MVYSERPIDGVEKRLNKNSNNTKSEFHSGQIDDAQPIVDWTNGIIRIKNDDEKLDSVSLLFLGDVFPTGSIEKRLLEEDSETTLEEIRQIAQTVDITIFNLECPLTLTKKSIIKKGPSLKADPDIAEKLVLGKINLACLANNHIMDFGINGVMETINSLDAQSIQHVGVGKSPSEACKPQYLEIRDFRISIFNSAEAEFSAVTEDKYGACDNECGMFKDYLIEMKKSSDIQVAVFHGGREYARIPPPHTYQFYNRAASQGFTIVIGHHPHVPQGIQLIGKSFVAYSLGNLVFEPDYGKHDKMSSYGYAVKAKVSKRGLEEIQIIPYKVKDGWEIQILTGKERGFFLAYLRTLSKQISSYEKVKDYWRSEAAKFLKTRNLPNLAGNIVGVQAGGSVLRLIITAAWTLIYSVLGFISPKQAKVYVQNALMTQSHRMFILEALNQINSDKSAE